MSDIELIKNEAASRYELKQGDEVAAFVDYVIDGDVIDLNHTETIPAFQGKGLAGKVVDFALADILPTEHRLRPSCPFVADRVAGRDDFAGRIAK
ncbi:N-acetyltransferase [Arachnia propionica]|uniref:N-acetyltransferase n=1 Tax=Arachnia propionica TaxID=1750 RepID=A0A3P1TCK4_9ACTN|nr:GNAT family N-acetyltransferase [Arachnia propionica]RRD07124.1 N-acetyltransferase [Arachnia propionica]